MVKKNQRSKKNSKSVKRVKKNNRSRKYVRKNADRLAGGANAEVIEFGIGVIGGPIMFDGISRNKRLTRMGVILHEGDTIGDIKEYVINFLKQNGHNDYEVVDIMHTIGGQPLNDNEVINKRRILDDATPYEIILRKV